MALRKLKEENRSLRLQVKEREGLGRGGGEGDDEASKVLARELRSVSEVVVRTTSFPPLPPPPLPPPPCLAHLADFSSLCIYIYR